MIRGLLTLTLLIWSSAAVAQGLDDRAARLLEGQLSGPGRDVEITGFTGALSTRAALERMTMSDGQGVWLVLENAVLDWTASPLLRGELQVDELSAARLDILRAPVSEIDPVASSEASGFRIPDLPITINIGRAALERIELGPTLLGTPVVAQFTGAARLEGGGLAVDLDAERLDGAGGTAQIVLSFAPDTEALVIKADIREPAEGVIARALALPGLPSVALRVDGEGTLNDFSSTLQLSTDGVQRFGGQVSLNGQQNGARMFAAALAGDIRPLLGPENQVFFGSNTEISASGLALPDGALELDDLQIETAQFRLGGQGALNAEGEPVRLALGGRLTGTLPGGAVSLDQAELSLAFDRAEGPEWRFDVVADAVQFAGGALARANLQGQGLLQPGTEQPFTGRLALDGTGLALDDVALQQAIGSDLRLETGLSLAQDGAFRLTDLQLGAAGFSATGTVTAAPADGRIALSTDLAAAVPDLGALGPLVPLQAGSARVDLSVSADLPGGAIGISLDGQTVGLDLGQPVLLPVLEPETTLSLRVARDQAGTRIERLALTNSALELQAAGSLSTQDGGLDLSGILRNPQALLADLPAGALRLNGRATQLVTEPQLALMLAHEAGAQVDLRLLVAGQAARFNAALDIPSLSPFAALLGPVERGGIRADITGQARTDTGVVEAQVDATTRALSIGNAQVAHLLEPETRLSATIRRGADGILSLTPLTVENPELSARATAQMTQDGPDRATLTATLNRPRQFLADLPKGALRMTATATNLSATPQAEVALVHEAGAWVDLTAVLEEAVAAFEAALDIPSLTPFAPLLGPVQAGAVTATVTGQADTGSGAVQAEVSAQSLGLETTIAQIAALVSPRTDLTASLARASDGTLTLERAALRNTALSADASARLGASGVERADLTATVTNLAQVVPELPGQLDVSAQLAGDQINVDMRSASGVQAQLTGQIGLPNGGVTLRTTGSGPLALAGPFIGNRALSGTAAFDLALQGVPGLGALSGQITSGDLRFADPDLGLVLSPATARIELSGGRAQIALQGALNEAPLEVQGSAGLQAPFQTDLTVALRNLTYVVDDLARMNVSADLTLNGPAQQQVTIAGDVRLGQTEIRVPDGGSGAAPLPPVRHVGASAVVRQTLGRAGLLGDNGSSGEGGVRFPLNLTIRALEPIFVRGRGLDAEFGGEFTVRGTAAAPIPTGQFSLRRGRLNLLGQRLNLTKGEIRASGRLIPDLDIVASSQKEGITAQVELVGPADAPELVLTSQPELPQDEILARLLFGRDVASLSAFQVAQLVASLASLTTGRPSLLEQSRGMFGVDDLDLRTDAATGQAELAIGNYISENIYSEVEIGAQGDTQVNLNLDLTDNTKIRGSVNSEGNTGVGVFWERDY